MEDFGFIMVRHVCSPKTNYYWQHNYNCIRKLYPETGILIIDDNSDPQFVTHPPGTYRCMVIKSEFPQAGEFLGYYYFWKTRYFKQAIIFHDSVFLHKRLPIVEEPIKFLWHFPHNQNEEHMEMSFLNDLGNKDLNLLYLNKKDWWGCFGCMSIIRLQFVDFLEHKYKMFECLLPKIKTRDQRMGIERIFAVLCTKECPDLRQNPSLFGSIFKYGIPWGTPFDFYLNNGLDSYFPIIKVWSGR